jgi:predicted GNAT family acetyltransferase
MKFEIVNNKKESRFETKLGDDFAVLGYVPYENGFALVHTFVPEDFRGQGIASALVHFAMEFIKSEDRKVIPACSAAMQYLESHPEYEGLVDQEYQLEN